MKVDDNQPAVLQIDETDHKPIHQSEKPSAVSPDQSSIEKEGKNFQDELLYGLEDDPPWSLTILLGIQHFLAMIVGAIAAPFILTPLLCVPDTHLIRGVILSAIIFTSGFLTLLQTTFGARLPIVQGPSFSYLIPTMALLDTKFPPCDSLDFSNMTQIAQESVYLSRIQEIQGSIAVSCLFQVIVGFSGLMGLFMTFLSPVSLVSIIGLIGLSLFDVAADKAAAHWGIAALTVCLMVLFSQFLSETSVPLPSYSKSKGFFICKFKAFKLFPVLLTLIISWVFCYILTATNALPGHSKARTDIHLSIIADSSWLYFPYPFLFGMPTISVAGIMGMLSGVLVSMAESIGDYYACAKLSGAPPPPKHAINRGLGMEGLGSIISVLCGSCTGSTSFSQNIGAIWITRVGSRRVVQACAMVMMFVGVMGKLCGLFMTIPTPVIGGIFIVLFSLITSVGLSNLQMIDLGSSRNHFVLGLSIFLGLSVPTWMKKNVEMIDTSYNSLNQVLVVLLSTPMFVGGVIAIILDNTIPGSKEERGILKWNTFTTSGQKDQDKDSKSSVYELPFGMSLLKRWTWCSRCPSSPTFQSFGFKPKKSDFSWSNLKGKLLILKSKDSENKNP